MTRAERVSQFAQARMAPAAAELAEALRVEGLKEVQFMTCSDEEHMTTIPAVMTRDMAFALAPRKGS